jgi:hypothetical protein
MKGDNNILCLIMKEDNNTLALLFLVKTHLFHTIERRVSDTNAGKQLS